MSTPAGVCRFCGCSEFDACEVDDGFGIYSDACYWTDRTRSCCSACAPAAKAEAILFRTLQRAGYHSPRPGIGGSITFVEAVHLGFIVGWFGVNARSPYGRNPFPRKPTPPGWALPHPHEAWNLGQRSGAEASRAYQRICGPLQNAPRREVLQGKRLARGVTTGRSRSSRTASKYGVV